MSDIKIYKGDYWSKTIKLKSTTTGKPIDITGYKFYMTIKTGKTVADASATLQITVTSHSAATEGTTVIAITSTQSNAITAGDYVYDIKMIDASSPVRPSVIGEGVFVVLDTVTDAVT